MRANKRMQRAYYGQGGIALGPELITNGDMEAGSPPSGWLDGGNSAVVTSVTDGQPGATGTKAMDMAVNTGQTAASVLQAITATRLRYQFSCWTKNVNGLHVSLVLYSSTWTPLMVHGVAATSWTQTTDVLTTAAPVAYAAIDVVGTAGQHGRINDISLKEIL